MKHRKNELDLPFRSVDRVGNGKPRIDLDDDIAGAKDDVDSDEAGEVGQGIDRLLCEILSAGGEVDGQIVLAVREFPRVVVEEDLSQRWKDLNFTGG